MARSRGRGASRHGRSPEVARPAEPRRGRSRTMSGRVSRWDHCVCHSQDDAPAPLAARKTPEPAFGAPVGSIPARRPPVTGAGRGVSSCGIPLPGVARRAGRACSRPSIPGRRSTPGRGGAVAAGPTPRGRALRGGGPGRGLLPRGAGFTRRRPAPRPDRGRASGAALGPGAAGGTSDKALRQGSPVPHAGRIGDASLIDRACHRPDHLSSSTPGM